MPAELDPEIKEILSLRRIAVVGCSSTPLKAAHRIPKYLQQNGYEIIPVNPNADSVLGKSTYNSLKEVEEEIDIVDVFRPSEEVAGIIDASIDRGDVDVVWLQLGIHDDDAVVRAEQAGIRVVQDRCMKPEHQRLIGLIQQ